MYETLLRLWTNGKLSGKELQEAVKRKFITSEQAASIVQVPRVNR